MLNEEEHKNLLEKIELLKKECNEIRPALEKIRQEREIHFNKKEEMSKEIRSLIGNIKSTKGNTDKLSKNIGEQKKQRDAQNKKTKELIAKIKELREQRNALTAGKNVNIGAIKNEIKRLEESIETNAYEYDKEKKIYKKIKGLRKVYKEHEGVAKLDDELNNISNEIDASRKQADESHQKFSEGIKTAEGQNSSFMDLAKKISLLKQQQSEEFELFKKAKESYKENINALKDKQAEIDAIKGNIAKDRKERTNSEAELQKLKLKEKVEAVKEKLKREKKLTREDFIILQADDSGE